MMGGMMTFGSGGGVDLSNLSVTWDDPARTYTGIFLDVTDTASASGSLLMHLKNASNEFIIDKFGNLTLKSTTGGTARFGAKDNGTQVQVYIGNSSTKVMSMSNNTRLGWTAFSDAGAGTDVELHRDGAGILSLRSGANPQEFRIFNTYTDASNYERGGVFWRSNALVITAEAAGTGTARPLHISGLPTSNPGAGILWNNAGNVEVGT